MARLSNVLKRFRMSWYFSVILLPWHADHITDMVLVWTSEMTEAKIARPERLVHPIRLSNPRWITRTPCDEWMRSADAMLRAQRLSWRFLECQTILDRWVIPHFSLIPYFSRLNQSNACGAVVLLFLVPKNKTWDPMSRWRHAWCVDVCSVDPGFIIVCCFQSLRST